MTTEEIKKVKKILYNIFNVEFEHRYTNQFYSQNPTFVGYYYETNIYIYFDKENRDFIKQKLINSKEIYEYDIYSDEGSFFLCNNLKNIDI